MTFEQIAKQIRVELDWRDTGKLNDAGFPLLRADLPGIGYAVISQVAKEPRTKTGRKAVGKWADYSRSRMFTGFITGMDIGNSRVLQGGSLDELKADANEIARELTARFIANAAARE
jgi:hypothetical protein